MLSMHHFVGVNFRPSSLDRLLTHNTSLAPAEADTYSASQVEVAVIVCLTDLQTTGALFKSNTIPFVVLLVSRQPAHSASLNASNCKSGA